MKATFGVLWGLMNIAGCSIGTPPVDEIGSIEALTSRDACVGSLNRWHRTFQFERKGIHVDKNIVAVSYERARQEELPAGRFITEPDNSTVINDRMRPVAWGYYDRSLQRFSDWSCGCSFPPYKVDHPTECKLNGS